MAKSKWKSSRGGMFYSARKSQGVCSARISVGGSAGNPTPFGWDVGADGRHFDSGSAATAATAKKRADAALKKCVAHRAKKRRK